MQKILPTLLFVIAFITQAKTQQRLFDQPVQLKICNISIEANSFIATTVIEMEFYNPKDQEVEARQNFELDRGQVITDFQLELDGRYREGSIEEKWKARQAYNSIVGKRIDPAILQMNRQNNYSINIYPVPAKGSRKVKFTITQMMLAENSKLVYNLPLNFNSITSAFKLGIKIKNPASIPYSNTGLLENKLFDMGNSAASLMLQAENITLNKPVSFSINQFTNEPQICISKQNSKASFLMRLFPGVPVFYKAKAESLNVYWDVSLSGGQRDLQKEIDFLERYITENEIGKTTIILFNHQLQGTIVFNRLQDNFIPIRNYLLGYNYNGATELGNLNFSNVLADRILVFSDGVNSIGNAMPKPGTVQVNCIVSTYNQYNYYNYYHGYYNNYSHLKNIIGNTGGSVISLYNTDVKSAVKRADTAENFLFRYNSNHIRMNENFPVKLEKSILLSGIIDQPDNLELVYGNNTSMYRSDNYFFDAQENCDEESYKKIQMLKSYDSLMYSSEMYYNWQNMIIFGLTERVVTPQTSFLVLERIEDYIKYKIAPPKELEEKCAELNYVYKPENKIRALKTFTEQESLESVVKNYNNRISWWSKSEAMIDLHKVVPTPGNADVAKDQPGKQSSTATQNADVGLLANFKTGGNELQEVVVTSAFQTKRTQRSVSSNAQVVTGEQVNTIRQTNVNNALAGKVAGLQVRSQSIAALDANASIRLGGDGGFTSSSILYVVDGTQVSNPNDINTDDIEDYTILQGPAATALYGPAGQNGVVVMTLKKGRRSYYNAPSWIEYKLSSVEDEDYIQEMQNAADFELWDTFLELEKKNQVNACFYFDMADIFFERGKADKALELMYNAIELCYGKTEGLNLAGNMYEKWKYFDKAIAIYQGILAIDENNLFVKRNLALAYYQNKNYELAVKTYYSIITSPSENTSDDGIKESALAEMNAVLVIHKNEFDISYINKNLIKPLPVDLRISVEGNYHSVSNLQVIEPKNVLCNYLNSTTSNGGHMISMNNYWGNGNITEYIIKNAAAGQYRLKVNAYGYGSSYRGSIPNMVRVIVFRNFQKSSMEIEIKEFNLDNQYGVIELDPVTW